MLQLPYLGMEEVTKDKLLISKQILAEFLGTLILVSRLQDKQKSPANEY
jgi:hypothetical protein